MIKHGGEVMSIFKKGVILLGVLCLSILGLIYAMSEISKIEIQRTNEKSAESLLHFVSSSYESLDANLTPEEKKNQFSLFLQKHSNRSANYVWAHTLDTNIQMYFHPVKPSLNGKSLMSVTDTEGIKVFVQMNKNLKNSANNFATLEYWWQNENENSPRKKISYFQQIPDTNIVIGVGYYEDVLAANLEKIFYYELAIAIIFMLLMMVFLAFVYKGIKASLNRIQNALDELSQKSGNQTIKWDVNDEFLSVVTSLNHVITKNAEHSGRLQSYFTDTVTPLVNKLQNSSTQVMSLADFQESNIDQIAAAAHETGVSASEVAQNAQLTANSCSEAQSMVDNITSTLVQLETTMELVVDKAQAGSVNIESLRDVASNIQSVIAVISGIAEQTNLLALNAAIEAARAGEQGRGFAVVADEVRQLASRTQEATKDIEASITSLSGVVLETVKNSDDTISIIHRSTDEAKAVIEGMQKITQSIIGITDQSAQVATAAEEQSSVMENMSKNISEISSGAQEVKRQAQGNSETVLELLTKTNQIK